VGAAALVLVTVGITLLGNLVQRTAGSLGDVIGVGAGTLAGGLVHVASFALSIVVVLLLYRFVPARGLRFRDGLVGAIVTALLLRLISLASGWVYERTTRLSVVYGSLTAALVFLYSMYLYSSALLLGAEVASAWSRPQSTHGERILTQLKRGLRGLFVKEKAPPAEHSRPDTTPNEPSGPRQPPRSD
jgi:membrane protein